jgi:hypothetical protein
MAPDLNTPKMNHGTIKKYLSETQFQILSLFKRHIFQSPLHPVHQICEIFREVFKKAYI